MTEEDRRKVGRLIERARRRDYGTKSSAYSSAGVNAATWDKIEAGESVREDRLTAAVKLMWPNSNGDWREVLDGEVRLDHSIGEITDDLEAIQAWAADPVSITPPPVVLDYIPNQDLLDEVERRMNRGLSQSEQNMPPAIRPRQENDRGNTAPIADEVSQPRPGETQLWTKTEGAQLTKDDYRIAAHPLTGAQSKGRQARRRQDEAGEAPDTAGPEEGA